MPLSQLKITALRNIKEAHLSLNSGFNLFFGQNAAGKTSVLEAICILSSGKSFRTTRSNEAIQRMADAYVISGIVQSFSALAGTNVRMGVERSQVGRQKLRINDVPAESMSELAKILPVQVLTVNSYQLLEEGPLSRRQFMDWGVFHVEHAFSGLWQRYNRALQQRNEVLTALKGNKKPSDFTQVYIWEEELCEAGEAIHRLRAQYLEAWLPIFSEILKSILGIQTVQLQYNKGWSEEKPLKQALQEAFTRDRALGHTTVGPHRADLNFLIQDTPAKALLSRGQLKLFVCALFLARAEALFLKTQSKCLILIDDIHAELDSHAAKILLERLEQLKTQVVITAIEKEGVIEMLKNKVHTVFHVEHGVISSMDD